MASSVRSAAAGAGRASMRHAAATRASSVAGRYGYAASVASSRTGAVSPADSVDSGVTASSDGKKRKERDFDAVPGGDETCINVVVRCRGRNEREVRENSNVVVRTEGVVKGKLVELSMGPNALSNKQYNFDRVFSPAADQSIVFDDVVKPILDEMLAGYNCTIFAYGQTGTGKTYTMSGDMTETLGMLSDEAGIIPRVLQGLFNKLEIDSSENCVRVSFIELYNEELRDLISVEEAAKLKIFDDTSRKGHATTIVQGMEEKHIKNAGEGIKVLQEGSLKRQVAATKCNDLSSRSHTVFTITAYVRRTGDDGSDELVQAGKLNLVDLAGSENIQRSGAENKRAAEAGLINKSLLTLGRVINALVDRSAQHIPYRESKLTRLLQDSLGGRTKTCIIATISPAKSNLEETISTLDYAFRAKNIRNKPQLNLPLNRKMLLRDFADEIEKLKSELICHRQRNGVYLSNEAYEDMTAASESRRIIVEEQSAKIETLETNLRNKVQELFSLTTTFMGLKKDHEGTKAQLDETQGVLDQTELVLAATRKSLAEETHIRKAHQKTERKLAAVGSELISTLNKTVGDVGGLHDKNKRKSDVQALNRIAWTETQTRVEDATCLAERRVLELRDAQSQQISSMSRRMRSFVDEELAKLSETQDFLDKQLSAFGESKTELLDQGQKSKDEMDEVLEEIKVVRDAVKERVGYSLQAISGAAQRIAGDVLDELDKFHKHLHASYSHLGRDFKTLFEDLTRHLAAQRSEADRLRRQLQGATSTMMDQNEALSRRMQEVVDEERRQAAEDRQQLLSQIAGLVNAQAEAQESRLAEKAALLQKGVLDSNTTLAGSVTRYGEAMDGWDMKEHTMLEDVKKSRDTLKKTLKDDWNAANGFSTAIQDTTRSVHAETVRVVDEQVADLDTQMEALDDFVARARSENAQHHEAGAAAVAAVSGTVEASYGNVAEHFRTTYDRVRTLGEDVAADADTAQQDLDRAQRFVCEPLADLREEIAESALREYQPTGRTPPRVQYEFPTELPITASHDSLIAGMHDVAAAASSSPTKSTKAASVTVFSDILDDADSVRSPPPASLPPSRFHHSTFQEGKHGGGGGGGGGPLSMSLREVNPNVTATFSFDPAASTMSLPADNVTLPMLKTRTTRGGPRRKAGGGGAAAGVDGRENMVPDLRGGTGPRRKSPRLH